MLEYLTYDEDKNHCTHLKTTFRRLSVFSQENAMENCRCIITVRHCVHCEKKGHREFDISLDFIIYIN
jgi:hypothetical protein